MTAQRKFPAVYLLHGKGGWPGGSVSQIETLLRPGFPELRYQRPALPHGRDKGERPAAESLALVRQLDLPQGALLVGISMGGLIAAALQEIEREDLHAICISSPTWAEGVELKRRVPNRVAFYSSADNVIAGRTEAWPALAEAYDLPWLTHDTDRHKHALARLIAAYMHALPLAPEVARLGTEA
ncbi:MAG: alpha/beta fold hydrolase [Terriglobales bacterium]